MPLKRNFRKRVTRRPKRTYKKKSYLKKGNFVMQKFRVFASTITINATAQFSYDYSPSISNIAANDLTAYAQLYDEYKITRIGIDFIPRQIVNTTAFTPFAMFSVLDRTDSNTLTGVAQANEYNNVKRTLCLRKHSRSMVPSVTTKLTDIDGTEFVQVNRPKWIELSNTSYHNQQVAHLGIKVISDTSAAANAPWVVDVYENLWIQFRVKN